MEGSRFHAYHRSPDTVLFSLGIGRRRRLCLLGQGKRWQVIECVQRTMPECFRERQGGEDVHYLRKLERRMNVQYVHFRSECLDGR